MLFNSIDIDGLAVYCLRLGMSEIAYMCLGIDIDGLGFFVVTLLLLLLFAKRELPTDTNVRIELSPWRDFSLFIYVSFLAGIASGEGEAKSAALFLKDI